MKNTFGKWLLAFCTISLVTFSNVKNSNADEITLPPVPQLQLDEPDVGKAISPLKLGQKAPFTGILLSPEAIAVVTSELKTQKQRVELEVNKAVKLCQNDYETQLTIAKIDINSTQQIADAKQTALVQQNDLLIKRIKVLEDSYVNPTWYIGGGFLGGIGITTAIILLTK